MTNDTPTPLDIIGKVSAYIFTGAVLGIGCLAVGAIIYAFIAWIPGWMFAAAMGAGGLVGAGVYVAEGLQHPRPRGRHLHPVDDDPGVVEWVDDEDGNVRVEDVPPTPASTPWPTYDPFYERPKPRDSGDDRP